VQYFNSIPGSGKEGNFISSSRPALGPTQSSIQWLTMALFSEVKRPRHEADNSSPTNAEFKNAWRDTSTPTIRLHGVVLN
jgi:hypothetical protein